MLKYAVILLDKTSVAYCHADNPFKEAELMPLDILQKAITWSMKENLMVQFVYPDYELPDEYLELIDTVDHTDIRPDAKGDICVIDGLLPSFDVTNKYIVARVHFGELTVGSTGYALEMGEWSVGSDITELLDLQRKVSRLNIIIKEDDIEHAGGGTLCRYMGVLSSLSNQVKNMYANGETPQVNILTDRLMLDSMNNCNAGWENITLAPNGKFYICPAFYYSDENDNVGSLDEGLDIKNPQLYRLDHAPICRNCDAYQCHRCVWLNRKRTLEVNTPSKTQCEIAHLERDASRELLHSIRELGEFLPDVEIPELDYLDPFEKIIKK